MLAQQIARIDPWQMDVIVVRERSHTSTERSAVRRDEERGLLLRIAHGAYVERSGFESLTPEQQHIVRMRAFAAVSDGPVTFSHWSAAVLHGLAVLRGRLHTLHVTVDARGERSGARVTPHLFGLEEREVVLFHELRVTGVGRTVLDIAGAAPFEEGVMAADSALRAGVPRELLRTAIDIAEPRRAGRRIGDVVAFAHPGAESAAESRLRVTMMRLGVEVPVLQHRVRLRDGSDAYLDEYLPTSRVGVEADGDSKYLDSAMAPEGAGRAVLAEKRREDEVRLDLRGLLRVGWTQAGSTTLLGGLLARLGVRPTQPRRTMADHVAAAARARPRYRLRHPTWRT